MSIDNYEDALEITLTAVQVKREIEKHSLSFNDFINEVGDKESYKGSEVLNWLGY
tara:strand:+ start:1435 stop:1599 length:165 start_codon:yes stop_codon:yes gene_type:complete